jgi:hypothetical protein
MTNPFRQALTRARAAAAASLARAASALAQPGAAPARVVLGAVSRPSAVEWELAHFGPFAIVLRAYPRINH